jgi:hypothetical protein
MDTQSYTLEADAITKMALIKRRGPQQEGGYNCGMCVVVNMERAVKLFVDKNWASLLSE